MMGFYANLKIKGKLLLGYGVVVCITFAIGIFGSLQIHKLSHADITLYENGAQPLEYIGQIGTYFQRLRANLRELLLNKEQNKRAYYLEQIDLFRGEIDSLAKNLETHLPDEASERQFAAFVRTRQEYNPHLKRVLELVTVGEDQATAYLQAETMNTVEHAEMAAIETLQHYLVVNAEKIAIQNTATANTSGRIMMGLACGTGLLAAFIALMITRGIVTPLLLVLGVRRWWPVNRYGSRRTE